MFNCKRWLEFGSKKRCPTFRLTGCSTASYPPSCPITDDKPKTVCVRWKCEVVRLLEELTQSSITGTEFSSTSSTTELYVNTTSTEFAVRTNSSNNGTLLFASLGTSNSSAASSFPVIWKFLINLNWILWCYVAIKLVSIKVPLCHR